MFKGDPTIIIPKEYTIDFISLVGMHHYAIVVVRSSNTLDLCCYETIRVSLFWPGEGYTFSSCLYCNRVLHVVHTNVAVQ